MRKIITAIPDTLTVKVAEIKSVFLLVLFFVSLLPLKVEATQQLVIESDRVRVVFPSGFKDQAGIIVSNYQEVLDDLKKELSWGLDSKPTVILVADKAVFERISGTRYAVGLAIPERNTIAINILPLVSKTYMMLEVFKHELCHLVLHEHIKSSFLPRWLDEGVAQWASGNLGELLLYEGMFRSVRLNLARLAIPLDYLATSFPSDPRSLFLAYEESLSFVNYVVKKYGRAKFITILEKLALGEKVEDAFAGVLAKPLDVVEKEWLDSIKNENRWLLWLSHYLYELLFVLGGLLAVIAFVELKLKKRRMDLEDDLD